MIEERKTSRQKLRSDETKRSIAEAAGRLFTSRGYDAVTMRDIAKEAGCSHTTIYIYFKDKEALLEQLAIPPLRVLEEEFRSTMEQAEFTPVEKVYEIGRRFVLFCLLHKSMVPVMFNVSTVRVDEADPQGEVNKLRNRLFARLTEAVGQAVPADSEQQNIDRARLFYYLLSGVVNTYKDSNEPADSLLERLLPLLDLGIGTLLAGMAQTKTNTVQNKAGSLNGGERE